MARYQPRHARSAPRGRRVLVLTAIILAGALTAGFMAGPASAATSRTFRIGSRGADVLAFERRLAGLHYDVGRVDGFYDNSTFHSVIAFQKVNGLARDGIAGPITKAKLAHPTAPRLVQRRSGSYVEINGWRTSKLGRLYRPAYFYGGYAVHGSWSVPAYPASHGCVRVTIAAMDRLYNGMPVGLPVKVYR